ncbi:putative oxidoreductase [Hordeum vulgare]|nr:putative oxidoreductase [Hordeum vulgare]
MEALEARYNKIVLLATTVEDGKETVTPAALLAAIEVHYGMLQSDMSIETMVADTMYHQLEKRSFAFSHCWIMLIGKPKWIQVVADLKASEKRNDGSSSHQSIGLDDEEDVVFVANGRATVPKDSQHVMGNKCEKNKKEGRYKLMLYAQKERMEWHRARAEKRLEIEREKIELEKQEAAIK